MLQYLLDILFYRQLLSSSSSAPIKGNLEIRLRCNHRRRHTWQHPNLHYPRIVDPLLSITPRRQPALRALQFEPGIQDQPGELAAQENPVEIGRNSKHLDIAELATSRVRTPMSHWGTCTGAAEAMSKRDDPLVCQHGRFPGSKRTPPNECWASICTVVTQVSSLHYLFLHHLRHEDKH
jgi:hypothetical protein